MSESTDNSNINNFNINNSNSYNEENINFSSIVIKLLDHRFAQTKFVNYKLREHFGSKLNISKFIEKINSFFIQLPDDKSELLILFPISTTNYCEIHPLFKNFEPNIRQRFYACTDYDDLISKITILAKL